MPAGYCCRVELPLFSFFLFCVFFSFMKNGFFSCFGSKIAVLGISRLVFVKVGSNYCKSARSQGNWLFCVKQARSACIDRRRGRALPMSQAGLLL